ncbi:MAG TPA: hypothetical protein ENJ62_00265 [Bryobacterales bacterium]|nr:hypothetical protein [Bryobacterales bacterium]
MADLVLILTARRRSRTRLAAAFRQSQHGGSRRTIWLNVPLAPSHASWDDARERRDRIDVAPRILARLPWPALSHWTRGCACAWPGEAHAAFDAAVLIESAAADHSALAALRRILDDRRICGSADGVRGKVPVVCLTAKPPDGWYALRRYQRHRQRWDFEPYGIAFDRDYLACRGARPVVYTPTSDSDQTGRPPHPIESPLWLQVAAGKRGRWRVEREWRWRGDLNLAEIPPDRAAVLVPDRPTAERLADVSPFPFYVLPRS